MSEVLTVTSISTSQRREALLWLNGLIFQTPIIPIVAERRHDPDNVDVPGRLHLYVYSSYTHTNTGASENTVAV